MHIFFIIPSKEGTDIIRQSLEIRDCVHVRVLGRRV